MQCHGSHNYHLLVHWSPSEDTGEQNVVCIGSSALSEPQKEQYKIQGVINELRKVVANLNKKMDLPAP